MDIQGGVTFDPFIVGVLNNCCTNPAQGYPAGWDTYRVETHCVALTFTAKAIDRDSDGLPTGYVIDRVETESC